MKKINYFNIILVFSATAAITAEFCCAMGIQPIDHHQEKQYLVHSRIALDIVLSIFVENNVNPSILVLNLITTSDTSRTRVLIESIFEFWRKNPIFILRLESIDKLTVLPGGGTRRRRICIFILDSLQDFDATSKKLISTNFMMDGYFIFVLIDATQSDLQYIFKTCWKLGLPNVLVVYQKSNETINVDSFVPFQPGKCRDTTPVTIVSIEKDHKINNKRVDYFPHKISNLYKCPIIIATGFFGAPAVVIEERDNGSYVLSGRDISVMKVIADKFNFTPAYEYVLKDQGFLKENGTGKGIFKLLIDGHVDIIMGDLWLKSDRLKFFHNTKPYASGDAIFIVPRGKELTAVEKFTHPFSNDLWIACIVLYLIGSLVISVVNFQSENMKNFVFGRNVKFPHLNMFAGLVGNTQPLLPGRNFARFILMNYLLYFLVIRTSYIGGYYNVLINLKFHKEIETIQELIDSDIEVHTLEVYYSDWLGQFPEIQSKVTNFFKNNFEMKNTFEKIATGQANYAVYTSKDEVVYLNYKTFLRKIPQDEKQYFHICKESTMSTHVVMYSSRSFFLMNKMDDIIDAVKTTGLVTHWERETYEKNLDIPKILKSMERPEPISITQLEGAFFLYLLCCAVCCLVFALEIIHKYVTAKFQ